MDHPITPDENAATDASESASFAELLTEYEQHHPLRPAEGESLQGTVVRVSDDAIVIDVGRKMEGLLDASLVRGRENEILVKPGDTLKVSIQGISSDGYYQLSTQKVEIPKDWSALEKAFADQTIIPGNVLEVVKGGLRVDIGERAFMPASRSGARDAAEMEKLVGQSILVRIIKVDPAKDDVVVDRRSVLEEEQAKLKESAFAMLQEGEVITGTVRNVLDFGAFVNIGPVDGLLHVTDMSWARVGKPSDLVKPGDQIDVKVLKINRETRKVSLGMKQLQPEPWTVAADKYVVGERVRGVVTRLTDFGAFVELEPGIEGLIHLSEMSWTKKFRKPSEILTCGESVEVVILSVNSGEKRIGLGLKQALGDPFDGIEARYPVGSIVEAPITNLAKFGAFVDLGDGIEGLIHIGDIAQDKRLNHPKEAVQAGEKVRAQVLEIDKERRRIRLGMRQLQPTTTDKYIAEAVVGSHVAGRIVEIKAGVAKVQLAEGVIGFCKLPVPEAPPPPAEPEPNQEAAVIPAGSSIQDLGAMLRAKWKSGSVPGGQKVFVPKPDIPRTGQMRQFRIAATDAEQKRIDLELIEEL